MNQSERKYLLKRVDKIALSLNNQLNSNLGKHWSIKEATAQAIADGKVTVQKHYKEIIITKIIDASVYSYGSSLGSMDIEDLLDGFVELKDKVNQHNKKQDEKIKIANQKLQMETDRIRDIMAMDQKLTQESAVQYLQDFEKYILL
tara:strand:+ start:610 stop:1047 length:438 start_codon:yes stop_codon:yes gene_type:complete